MRLLLLVVLMASTAKTIHCFCLHRPLRPVRAFSTALLMRQARPAHAQRRRIAAPETHEDVSQGSAVLSRIEYLHSTIRAISSINKRNLPPKAAISAMHSTIPPPAATTTTTTTTTTTSSPPVGAKVDRRQFRIEENNSDMEIVFLGTASCVPTAHRGVSCTGMRFGSESWLFDVGEGSQIQIQQSVIRPSRVRRIFITHLHGDHVWGLPGMMLLAGKDREQDPQREQLVEIYGPEGIRQFLRTSLEMTYSKATPSFKVHELKPQPHSKAFHRTAPASPSAGRTYNELQGTDIYPDENGVYHLFDTGEVTVAASQIKHSVPCFGFVVREHDRAGRLKVETATQLIQQNKLALQEKYGDAQKTNRYLKALKPGEQYTFPDGTVVGYDDVMDPPYRGRKVAILGDTSDPSNISALAKGADVLVHEATNNFLVGIDEGTNAREVERDAKKHGHSTAEMAGRFARRIGARKLLLNHFSSRYMGDGSHHSVYIMQQIEKLARRAMGSKPGDDNVIAAWDMLRVPLPINKPPKAEVEAPEVANG